MSFVEAIARKRDGLPLERDDIRRFVGGATRGDLPVEQLAAMLMAICCRGMSAEETSWLTDDMLRSGEAWDLAASHPTVVDKHSTGGVGDTVSLVLAPLLAAVGVPVAMMAGRGLGHTQGTIDKLEAIPGFDCDRDRAGLDRLLELAGAAIIAQTADIAPADRRLYALRDVTASVPSLPLIVGSIMSKKLALGAATLVLDVKWGRGAFRTTVAEAHELAAALRRVARDAGVACEALITDMNQPLGSALGTASEVRAAVAVLQGEGDESLREVSLRLAEQAMVLRGADPAAARSSLERVLAAGDAMAAWIRMVEAHGGDPDPDRLARPSRTVEVVAERAGFLTGVAATDLGRVAVTAGAGRSRLDEPLDFAGGVRVHCRLGDRVERGQPLATLELGERPVDETALCSRIGAAFELGDDPPATLPALVLGTVDEVDPGARPHP
ncbi:MAG: thymidine phosphorylase [Thermoanaerobaculales bacterium]|jgi:pyrimidine-nucleoside phosphorylase|nr:thymidine phosphorylase [Thermoanaerobaculales bacterium]